MRVPLDWLGEYVELPAGTSGAQVAAALVRVGLEEEGLYSSEVSGPLVVGRVLTRTPQEQKNGKTINWCTVDVGDANGTGQPQGIVCGAHNFDAGDLVVVVLPGGVLPGGFEITARKTYGHVSAGMICSMAELGLGEDHDGIIVLTGSAPDGELVPGQDAIALLGLDRETVEVNVTPDRGYCFSMRGIAREYGHSTGARFADPVPALTAAAPAADDAGWPVRLADGTPIRGRAGCDRYVARTVTGVEITAPTPGWMATRLTEAGMRPISLPVDVTNYVMLALGQPLHAFDAERLLGGITVRRAEPGERITTLDGVDRALDGQDLLITDDEGRRPIAIAGVMGGAETEVTASTREVLIEAAHFDQVSIARSARRHKLPSEASRRFERGVDPQLAAAAAQFAVDLLVEHGGATAAPGATDVGHPSRPASIILDTALPTRLVGVDYPAPVVIEVLREIGCQVEDLTGSADESPGGPRPGPAHTVLEVQPPSWRPDLTTAPDLVEEVARIRGYDQIPSILPTPPGGRGLTAQQRARRVIANVLASQGLSEVWSAPFVSDERHAALGYPVADARARTVRLANPLSDEAPLMRISVLSTLVDALRRNVSRGARDVGLFELGLVLALDGPQRVAPTEPVGVHPEPEVLDAIRAAVPAQPRHLGILMAGDRDRAGWWGPGRPAEAGDVIDLVRAIGTALGVPVTVTADDAMPFHPGRCARFTLGDGTLVGHAGELHPKVTGALGLPARTVAAEVDVDALVAAAGEPARWVPVSTAPLALQDVALIVPKQVPAAQVEAALRAGAGDLLESVTLFDLYSGDQVAQGHRSLAFRLGFRAPDRTLTTEEVSGFRDAAVAAAADRVGAIQR